MTREEQLLNTALTIFIVSGEGVQGKARVYNGKRTRRAIRSALTRARAGGDRWAKAQILVSQNEAGNNLIDFDKVFPLR